MVRRSRIARLLISLVTAPVTVVVVLFALSNRHPAELHFWPLVGSAEVPLYLIGLATMLVGFAFGALVAWVGAGETRSRARQAERDARHLRVRLADARSAAGSAGSTD